MNNYQLSAQSRKLGSKGILNALRRAGRVPAVLHDRGKPSMPLSLVSGEIKRALGTKAGRNVLLDLRIDDGEPKVAMFENFQRDPVKDLYLHVDMVLVALDQKLEVNVPVILTGEDRRENDGGVLSQHLHEVILLSLPTSIPENIRIDVRHLKLGDAVHMRDLELPEGCDTVTETDQLILNVTLPRVVEEEVAAPEEEESAAAAPTTEGAAKADD